MTDLKYSRHLWSDTIKLMLEDICRSVFFFYLFVKISVKSQSRIRVNSWFTERVLQFFYSKYNFWTLRRSYFVRNFPNINLTQSWNKPFLLFFMKIKRIRFTTGVQDDRVRMMRFITELFAFPFKYQDDLDHRWSAISYVSFEPCSLKPKLLGSIQPRDRVEDDSILIQWRRERR